MMKNPLVVAYILLVFGEMACAQQIAKDKSTLDALELKHGVKFQWTKEKIPTRDTVKGFIWGPRSISGVKVTGNLAPISSDEFKQYCESFAKIVAFVADPQLEEKKVKSLVDHITNCTLARSAQCAPPNCLLDLKSTDAKKEWLDKLQSVFSIIVGIDLSENTAINGNALAKLNEKELPSFKYLTLNGTSMDDDGLKAISNLKHITLLMLNGTNITDNGLQSISNHQELTQLHLSRLDLTDEGLKRLAGLKKLEDLDLNGNNRLSDKCLESIKAMTSLELLKLSNTNITNDGLQQLASLPNLAELRLGYNKGVTDDGVKHLLNIKGLRRVALDGTQVSSEGKNRLRAKKIEVLDGQGP